MDVHTYIHWVPGHVEVEGNHKANQLAKKGTERMRKERDAYTSITYIKRWIREKARQTWKERWPSLRAGRSYHRKLSRNIHPLIATTTTTKQPFENNSTTNTLFINLTPDSESSSLISPTLLILEPCLFL
jgi:hypothetical protein